MPLGNSMTDCDEAMMTIAEVLDLSATTAERRLLAAHLRCCSTCRETFLSLVVDGVERPLSRAAG